MAAGQKDCERLFVMQDLIRSLSKMPKKDGSNGELPLLRAGDTVRVMYRIVEGDRERLQPFQGVIMRLRGNGATQRFTVRRLAAHGVGVERTFVMNSPRLDDVKVLRHGQVRRAHLSDGSTIDTGPALRKEDQLHCGRTTRQVIERECRLIAAALHEMGK